MLLKSKGTMRILPKEVKIVPMTCGSNVVIQVTLLAVNDAINCEK